MKYTIVLPALIAFIISAVLCPVVIPFLHKLKFGQFIRDEGPAAHQKKSGTPTMGGVIFIVSVIVTSLIYMKDYPAIIPVTFATLGFGIVGFMDDYINMYIIRCMAKYLRKYTRKPIWAANVLLPI